MAISCQFRIRSGYALESPFIDTPNTRSVLSRYLASSAGTIVGFTSDGMDLDDPSSCNTPPHTMNRRSRSTSSGSISTPSGPLMKYPRNAGSISLRRSTFQGK